MLKAALYARVSSEEQAKRENSILHSCVPCVNIAGRIILKYSKNTRTKASLDRSVNVLRFSRCFPLPFPEKSM